MQLPDLTEDTVKNFLLRDDIPDDVRKVLEIRQAVSKTSVAKFSKVGEIVCKDNTMKGLLTYHGAGPGRYSSRGGLNIQNLPRPEIKDIDGLLETLLDGDIPWINALYGLVPNAASSAVRAMIRAPAGHRLLVADYKAIENRCGPWLAEDKEKLKLFRKGLDEYIWFASNHLYRVPWDDVTDRMRYVAKQCCLGCLYGQGAVGYREYARKRGIILTRDQSKETVDIYREVNEIIVQYWYECNDAAINATRHKGQKFTAGKLMFWCGSNWLLMFLPSGRPISFYKPRIENLETPWGEKRDIITILSINTHTRQWGRNKIIGSSIFQSANQGNARDIMVHGMLNCEAAGYHQIMTVHDELVALVKNNFGSLEEFYDLVLDMPRWAKGLPLAVEGYEAERYRK